MYRVPLLLVRPNVSGIIRLNDNILGEASFDMPLTTPCHPSGNVYITLDPLENSLPIINCSITRKIKFFEGKLTAPFPTDGVSIKVWPNDLYQVDIQTPIFMSQKVTTPYTITQGEYIGLLGNKIIVTIFEEQDVFVALEQLNVDRVLFLNKLSGNNSNYKIDTVVLSLNKIILIQCDTAHDQKQIYIIVEQNNEFFLVLEEKVNKITINGDQMEIMCLSHHGKHKIFSQFDFASGAFALAKTWQSPQDKKHQPKDRSQTALQFLECIQLNLANTGLSMLTDSLKDGLSYDDLLEFLDNFGDFYLSPFTSDIQDCVNVALEYKVDSTISNVRLFAFEFYVEDESAQVFLIDNIREL